MEVPSVAGVAGGVGTSILAAALRAKDCRVYPGQGATVHVLVAQATAYSLGCAQRALAAAPKPPILAVVAAAPRSSLPAKARGRLEMLEPLVAQYLDDRGREYGAIVHVPFVTEWLDDENPQSTCVWHVAAQTEHTPGQRLPPPPRHIRPFLDAVYELIEFVEPLLAEHVPARVPVPAATNTTVSVSSPPGAGSVPWLPARYEMS